MDLVLFDIMLLGKDGMIICRDLCVKWFGSIVFLIFFDSDMNYILVLEMGVCDYIFKMMFFVVLLVCLCLYLCQNE